MDFCRKLMVPPDKKITLVKFDPADTHGYHDDQKTQARLEKTIKRLDELQNLLYAEKKRALLRKTYDALAPRGSFIIYQVTNELKQHATLFEHGDIWEVRRGSPSL